MFDFHVVLLGIYTLWGAVLWRKSTAPFRALMCYMVFNLLETSVSRIFAILYQNNLWIFRFYWLCVPVFFFFVYPNFYKNRFYKAVVIVLLIISEIVAFGDVIFNYQPGMLPSISGNVIQLSLVIAALLHLLEMLLVPELISIARNPKFWLNSGVVLYNALSFIFLSAINFFISNSELSATFVLVNMIITYFSWSLFTIAIYLDAKNSGK